MSFTNQDLCLIFEDLRTGARRSGWDWCDHAEHQLVFNKETIWARRIDEENRVGDWVILPAPVVGHV